MSRVEPSPVGFRLDGELAVLQRFAGPSLLLARAMLAYIFIVESYGKITNYQAVGGYMAQYGVAAALLPAVILTELGGGLLVLLGLKTRWAALALAGFCLLTALFFHMAEAVQFQKNVAMAGGFLALATGGAGPWSIDAWRSPPR
ncbi:MAG: DoxX family protein [Pseudomonadota bacterium]|nr:DoxX family protein [Pseudomonadota bacterium]